MILKTTREALLKVRNGTAVYERDSVLFDKVQHSFPLLAGLLRASAANEGRLTVADFGGSLGSTYYQCRAFLGSVHQLRWGVIEQPTYVACGRKEFESEELQFFESIEECLGQFRPDVLLLSAVLHYLPEPHQTLNQLLAHNLGHLIIDRTPFLPSPCDRLTVQHVPEEIYSASYPCWFFNEENLLASILAAGYRLVADFPGFDKLSPPDAKGYCKGFIFERTDKS